VEVLDVQGQKVNGRETSKPDTEYEYEYDSLAGECL
jgi:hypothetical protein